jgi:hypothetical protein
MILLVETERNISKRLCDMLSRERIITVESPQAAFEAIVKHRKKLDVIIADIYLFKDVLSSDILTRVCARLSMDIPPLVIIYREKDVNILPKAEKIEYKCSFLKYELKDMNFPEKYVRIIRSIYPEVVANMIVANEVWLDGGGKQEIVDVSKWFTDHGFIKTGSTGETEPVDNTLAGVELTQEDNSIDNIAYKKLYDELNEKYHMLKLKYDDLIKQMKKLSGLG